MRERAIRVSAFLRAELVSTLRQPRLLLVLVMGPFLVLFVFGLGYEARLPTLSTLVVGADGELTDQVDDFIRRTQPAGIDYRGTTVDREAALAELRDDGVDLVVVLPERAMSTLEANERAVIEVHQRSLDPVTYSQVIVAADSAVAQINDEVLSQVVSSAQEQSADLEAQLGEARRQLAAVRAALDRDDLAALQQGAGALADRFEELADVVARGGGLLARLGTAAGASDLEETLRTGASQLRAMSELEASERLDEAATTLATIDDAVRTLRAVDPEIVVRPFEADVVSATPVAVTLDRFYAPGLVALMLQHIAITFAALSLVRERQQRTVELLEAAPVTTGDRLAGKSVAFLLLGSVVAVALTILIVLSFDVPVPTHWGEFVALLLLTIVASLGIGFVIAGISATDSQAVQYSMLLLLTAIFFSGLFMPLDRIAMPVEIVSWLMPATYAFVGLQDLMLLQQGIDPILLAGLGAIGLVTFVLARVLVPRARR
jgi:ABC-2 type transport system permease protein